MSQHATLYRAAAAQDPVSLKKNVFHLLVCPQFVLIVCIVVAAIIIGEMQHTKFDNEEPRRSQAGVIA